MGIIDNPLFVGLIDLIPIILILSIIFYFIRKRSINTNKDNESDKFKK
tara:strand:+ start:89 stop:232 length:144 start_codon:yes stop_codon:yes gene_type:complete